MAIRFTRGVMSEISNFYVNNPIASLVEFETSIRAEIQSAYNLTKKGVKTNTPLLPQWDGKYNQLYCKNSGWFFAYKPIRGGIRIYHAVHQTEMKDMKGIALDITMNQKQDTSMMTTPTWTYVRDANYGFGIVRNSSGQFNYSNLNGDLLITDNNGNPIWFDNVSPFSEGWLDRLSAYGIKDGKVVFFYSDGHYILTNTPASKYGFINTSVLNEGLTHATERKKNVVYIKESQLRSIIRETIRRILLTA